MEEEWGRRKVWKLKSELLRATVREAEHPSARTLYGTLRIYLLGDRKPGVIILNWLIPLGVLNPWHAQDALKVPRQVAIMAQKASDRAQTHAGAWGEVLSVHTELTITAAELRPEPMGYRSTSMSATASHLSTVNANIHEHIHMGLMYRVWNRKCHWGCGKSDKENVSMLTHSSELTKLFRNKWRKLEYHFLSLYSLHIDLFRKSLDHQIAPKPTFPFSYQH